ncbi:MAG: AAA family ATPase, partial [Phycisphaerae bacterium]
MLTGLTLENFKAFGQPTKIDLAPITLIFGENSAGKTSILQSLNLLKQTAESRELGALLLPRTENGLVDLGGFQDLIFDHHPTNALRLKFSFSEWDQSFTHPLYRKKLRRFPNLTLQLEFSR